MGFLLDRVFFCRVPWPPACQFSVLWCHMALGWHPSLSRTPTVYQYWRNSRGNNNNSSNSNSRHSRQTQVQHTVVIFFPNSDHFRFEEWAQALLSPELFSQCILRKCILFSIHAWALLFVCLPGLPGTSGQTPQLFHSQTVGGSTTTALPGNTPLFSSPLTPMTPITPATPASESSGIVPQLQYVKNRLTVSVYTTDVPFSWKLCSLFTHLICAKCMFL